MKKSLYFILILLSFLAVLSIFLYSNATPVLSSLALLISLAFAMHSIIQKHKGKPSAYKNIFQEICVFLITLLLVLMIGGLVSAFANVYIGQLYGAIWGLVSGLILLFIIGYLIAWVIEKWKLKRSTLCSEKTRRGGSTELPTSQEPSREVEPSRGRTQSTTMASRTSHVKCFD